MNKKAEQLKALKRKLLKFQIEFHYQLGELYPELGIKMFSKNSIYEYYGVNKETFFKWLVFFISEDFKEQFNDLSKTVSLKQWMHINKKLGYSHPILKSLNSAKAIMEELFDYERLSTVERKSFKEDFKDHVTNGVSILNSNFKKFPPIVVKEFLLKKIDSCIQGELHNKLSSLKRLLSAKDNPKNIYEFPELYNPTSQKDQFYKKREKAFYKALKEADFGYKHPLRKELIKLYGENKIREILTLTIRE